jgi:large subunit ribosomal protein L4
MKKDIQQENIKDSDKEISQPTSNNLETEVFNLNGKVSGKMELPESIFGLAWNGDLVHQVVTAMQANARTPVAHTKTRGEVRGGGKKPWKQKGTGRARHGSSRSPIWVGGGVAHGPRNDKIYAQKINKKMKVKALFTILSEKYRRGQILFLEELKLKELKTKEASQIMESLSKVENFGRIIGGKNENTYITVPAKEERLKKSFANLPTVKVEEIRNINPVDLLSHRYVIISHPKESFAFLGGKMER